MLKTFDLATSDRREMLLDKDRLHALGLAHRALVGHRQSPARHAGAAQGGAGRGQGRSEGESKARRSLPSDGEMLGFAAVAVVLLAASLGVVLTPNLFHAVLYLAAAPGGDRRGLPAARRAVPVRRPAAALRRRRGHHRGLRDHADRAAGRRVRSDRPAAT
jgi:hypothetical protein